MRAVEAPDSLQSVDILADDLLVCIQPLQLVQNAGVAPPPRQLRFRLLAIHAGGRKSPSRRFLRVYRVDSTFQLVTEHTAFVVDPLLCQESCVRFFTPKSSLTQFQAWAELRQRRIQSFQSVSQPLRRWHRSSSWTRHASTHWLLCDHLGHDECSST